MGKLYNNKEINMDLKNYPKVRFRAMEPEDVDLLFDVENERPAWVVGVSNVPYSRYTLQEFVALSTNDIYSDKQVRLMADNELGETVGIADLVNFSPTHMRAEVGILISKPFRRRGYGVSVLCELVSYAFEILHLHQLYACVDAQNEASVRTFEKAQFLKNSVLKDWLYDGKGYRDAFLMQFFRVF